MKKIGDSSIEIVPSWSWMKREGVICYVNIPKVNIGWIRDIKIATINDLSPNGEEQRRLAAPVVRILQGCYIEPRPDTNCKIKDANYCLVGWIRFDDEDEVDIARLGYIVCLSSLGSFMFSFTRP
jgi:hypothetical protein